MAVNEAFRFAFASLCLDRAWNLMKFGIAIAARMPMIATTIISSMRVKPLRRFFICDAPFDGTGQLTFEARRRPPDSPCNSRRLRAKGRWSDTTKRPHGDGVCQ